MKFLKIGGIIFLILILTAGGGLAWLCFSDLPHYEVKNVTYTVHSTPEKVARGKKLASMLCYNCHVNYETGKLTGREMKDAPEFGFIYAQNITQDPQYGIGSWTDAELMYLLRSGINRHGRYVPPYMPKLPHMADTDIESIIAFLRSDDPMVASVAIPDKPCRPSLLTKFLSRVAFKPLPLPEKAVTIPDSSDKIAYGKYLVINLDCWTCHSASFQELNIMEPEKTKGYLGGGNPIKDDALNVIVSANITPHPSSGIGKWSEEKFIRALKTGTVDGRALRYPMIPYTHLTDAEAAAMYAYLKTVPPIDNKVTKN